jgi:hypothetical protein
MSGATAKKESMRLCIALGLRSDARVCHDDNNDWSSPLQCYADWRMIGHDHLCGWTGTRHSLQCNQAYDCGQHHFRAVRDGAPEGIDQAANGEQPDPESVPWVHKKPLAGPYTSESFSPSRSKSGVITCSSALQGDRQRLPIRYPAVHPKISIDRNTDLWP